ncbi:MAG: hypothetical protein R3D29_05005 [Nitratireductor sp.]
MMRGGGMAQQPTQQSKPQARQQPEERYQPEVAPGQARQRKGGLEDIFGDMFETGKSVQKDYQRNVESIFDDFLGGMQKR